MNATRGFVWSLLLAIGFAVGCGGGGGGTPPAPPPPPPTSSNTPSSGTPTPIPTPTGNTGYYLAAVSPANGVPAYISDAIYLQFSQAPNLQTTENAISVTPLTPGVPTPLPTRFITQVPNYPNTIGIKFFAQAGASYRITIASTATSQSGASYGGLSAFTVTLPTTPPLPAPVSPQPQATYFYGLSPGGTTQQILNELAPLTPKIVRIGTDMSATEPSQGQFSFSGLDGILQTLANAGIAVDLLLTQYNAPEWAVADGGPAPPTPAPPAGYIPCTPQIYAQWVAAVVQHVSNAAQHPGYTYPPPAAIEIGNEPDTPAFWVVDPNNTTCTANQFQGTANPAPYVPYLEEAASQARPYRANGTVFLNAGIATNADDETYFLSLVQTLVSQGFVQDLDGWAIHLYAWADPDPGAQSARTWQAFTVLTDDMQAAANAGATKPFWVTEGAFTSNPFCPDGVDPQTQGYFLVADYNRMAAISSPSYVASFIYFELQDQASPSSPQGNQDPCFEPAGMGLFDVNGVQRKPVYQAFYDLTHGI
jgi:hypothetical protein